MHAAHTDIGGWNFDRMIDSLKVMYSSTD
jgi:hypothetical protein